MIDTATFIAAVVASLVAMLRWMRVAQREHYLPGSVVRFALRWWTSRTVNLVGIGVAIAGAIASIWLLPFGLSTVVIVAFGPLGLGLRGRTAPLAWTPRLRRLAVAGISILAIVLVAGRSGVVGVVAALATPVLVDVALLILWPIETRWSARFVREASRRLASVAPEVVATALVWHGRSTNSLRPERTCSLPRWGRTVGERSGISAHGSHRRYR